MNQSVDFSVFVVCRDWSYPELRTVVQEAERLGFSAAWHEDNITGHSPVPRDLPGFDVWAVLPALAEATNTIRLGPMATPVPRRFAPLLAKTAASFDVISGGRLDMALGAGDDTYQYEMIGQEFPERKIRVGMLREAIEVMKLMWSEKRANFSGEHYHLSDAILSPKPLQKPNPPIWVAISNSKRVLPRLAAEYGDAICITWGPDQDVAQSLDSFVERCDELKIPKESRKMARHMWVVLCEEGFDWKPAFTQITHIPMDWSLYASPATVPEGEDGLGFAAGPPEKVAAEVKRRTIDMGFNHVMLNFLSVGSYADAIDTDGLEGWSGNYLGTMRRAVEEILPTLKG